MYATEELNWTGKSWTMSENYGKQEQNNPEDSLIHTVWRIGLDKAPEKEGSPAGLPREVQTSAVPGYSTICVQTYSTQMWE